LVSWLLIVRSTVATTHVAPVTASVHVVAASHHSKAAVLVEVVHVVQRVLVEICHLVIVVLHLAHIHVRVGVRIHVCVHVHRVHWIWAITITVAHCRGWSVVHSIIHSRVSPAAR